LISLENLVCRRGDRVILDRFSARFDDGTVTVLTGANGSGKTTLLRVLAGLLPVDDGGLSGVPHTPHWISSQPLPPLRLTARDYLAGQAALMAAPFPADASLGLGDALDTRLETLSMGWRQRVKLARLALADRPIWLLDEPSDHLDAAAARDLAARINAHAKGGGIAVIATHQPDLWPQAQRIVLS